MSSVFLSFWEWTWKNKISGWCRHRTARKEIEKILVHVLRYWNSGQFKCFLHGLKPAKYEDVIQFVDFYCTKPEVVRLLFGCQKMAKSLTESYLAQVIGRFTILFSKMVFIKNFCAHWDAPSGHDCFWKSFQKMWTAKYG